MCTMPSGLAPALANFLDSSAFASSLGTAAITFTCEPCWFR
jgi:hypothetical protein